MKTALTLLDDVRIASPCPANWEDMAGDDRSRHCSACDRTVYDLSAMTASEAVALIREKEGRLCARLFRRSDGRVLTADCPVGLRARLGQVGRATGAWLTALFVLLGFGFLIGRGTHPNWPWRDPPWKRQRCLGAIELPPQANEAVDPFDAVRP
jgi:hypothetical protein